MMDNFTKMCNHPLIQDGWEQKVFDRCYYKTKNLTLHQAIIVAIGLNDTFKVKLSDEREYWAGPGDLIYKPTIEQLTEMAWETLGTYCSNKMNSLTWGVWNFYNEIDDLDSKAELWLAYVMNLSHNLKWSGKEWERDKAE